MRRNRVFVASRLSRIAHLVNGVSAVKYEDWPIDANQALPLPAALDPSLPRTNRVQDRLGSRISYVIFVFPATEGMSPRRRHRHTKCLGAC